MYVCVCMHVCIHIYVCMCRCLPYVCLCVCVLCVCVCMCMSVCTCDFFGRRRRTNSRFDWKKTGQNVPVQVHRVNESINNRINGVIQKQDPSTQAHKKEWWGWGWKEENTQKTCIQTKHIHTCMHSLTPTSIYYQAGT